MMKTENRLTRLLLDQDLLPFPVDGGHIALFRMISDYILDEGIDERGNTTLMRALIEKKDDDAIQLIECGANVDHHNNKGDTPIDIVFERRKVHEFYNVYNNLTKKDFKIILCLIKSGLDVNVRDKDGRTTLIHVARVGYTEITKALIEAGADVNVQDNYKMSALMYACENGHSDIALLLINVDGMNPNLQNCRGENALILASKCYFRDLSKVIKALVKVKGINLNLQDQFGDSALHENYYNYIHIIKHQNEIAKALIRGGMDATLKNKIGRNALRCVTDEPDVVDVLIESKVSEFIDVGKKNLESKCTRIKST